MMKIGLNTNTFDGESLDTVLPLAKEAGISYLELWGSNLEPVGPQVNRYAFSDKDLKKAKAQIEKAGLTVGCLSSGLGLDEEFVKDAKTYSAELVKTVEAAAFFGAKVINHYSTKIHTAEVPNMDFLHPYWDAALKRAEELGIVLALENEAVDVTRKPENMKKIIEAMDSPNFRTNYDPTNYYHSANEAFPYAYELLQGYIAYVHIKNGRRYESNFCHDPKWVGGPMTRDFTGSTIYYCEAKEGVVNIDGVIRRLAADGYEGFCTLEPHTTRENAISCIHNEVAYLRSIGLFEK